MAEEEIIDQQELFEHHRFIVDPGQSLLRIDKFLSSRIENVSRTRVQEAANAGNILVNNNPVKPNYRVKPDDVIQVVLPNPPREVELFPENIPINIVYEDDDVIVVNKEPGMVVHPAYGNYTGTLVNALMWHFRDLPLFSTGEQGRGLGAGVVPLAAAVAATFHSLEDRIVKRFFVDRAGRLPSASRHMPDSRTGPAPSFALPFKGHLGATDGEIARNPRARSAKLRAGIRTDAPPMPSIAAEIALRPNLATRH